jgi:ABC-type phosphate/phosphonate transport system substrate-binding protein
MASEHPDLVEIDRSIRTHLDRVLRAEQEAADLTRRRLATLRDRLIDLEERAEPVVVTTSSGDVAGVVESVGADHTDIITASGSRVIALDAIHGFRVL